MLPELITPAAAAPLLAANELPTDDLDGVELLGFSQDGQLVGVVGLQRLDGCVLLRSLAVATTARGRGLGGELCDAALERAGSVPVWLLTTTARDYFARRGFVAIERDLVPSTVRATAQFASLCPSTATVMWRSAT